MLLHITSAESKPIILTILIIQSTLVSLVSHLSPTKELDATVDLSQRECSFIGFSTVTEVNHNLKVNIYWFSIASKILIPADERSAHF